MKLFYKFAVSVLIAHLLTACGGSSTGSGSGSGSISIGGAVIDGYIEGAKVCLDVNGNGTCDSIEPSATTDSNGRYNLSYNGNTTGLHILTEVPSTAKDKDDNGMTLAEAGKSSFTLLAPAPSSSSGAVHVTPLSTMVSQEMIQTGSTSASTVESMLKVKLGISANLLNNDFKANNSGSNALAADLAVAITNAIGAAQSSLAGNAAFITALGSSDLNTINAAAAKAAVNIVMQNVLPAMIDKQTGGLNSSIDTTTARQVAGSVATANSASLAIKVNAPKAEVTTIQAFLDGVVIGNKDSGVYKKGNLLIPYQSELSVGFIKVNSITRTSAEKHYVLIEGKWYERIEGGGAYWLTSSGWIPQKIGLGGMSNGDCIDALQTQYGPNMTVCLTKYDVSGKKVASVLKDPCRDNNDTNIPNCDSNKVFPANTYSYTATAAYDQEAVKIWVSSNWDGYGSNLASQPKTLDAWLNALIQDDIVQWIGESCNVGFKVHSYDSNSKTGVFKFADYSGSTNGCFGAHLLNPTFISTADFSIKTIHGKSVLLFQAPMMYKKLNPTDGSFWKIFTTYDDKIYDAEYYPANAKVTFGMDGFSKLGNANFLNTVLNMIGADPYPYF